MGDRWRIVRAEIREGLRELSHEGRPFDAVLTDAPYELGFMGKSWDRSGVAFDAKVWAQMHELLRPGAHLLSFGGTRTFHRMTCAIEDAGFEIRDCLSWLYASGFPKSLDVSKAIDAAAGAEREVIGHRPIAYPDSPSGGSVGKTRSVSSRSSARPAGGMWAPRNDQCGEPEPGREVTAAATEGAARFDGYGTALKPAWEPIVLARRPLDGTVASNATFHGTGGINVDGCRIGPSGGTAKGNPPKGSSNGVYGDGINGACDVLDIGKGRWPANLVLAHADGCVQSGTRTVDSVKCTNGDGKPGQLWTGGKARGAEPRGYGVEEVPVWCCVPGCPVAELDRQSGDRPGMSGGGQHRADYGGGMFGGINSTSTARGDFGGASRFFFCAKASRSEREFGCDALPSRTAAEATDSPEGSARLNSPRTGAGRTADRVRNFHPCVKPIALCKWLATLLLPPPRKDGQPRRILVPYSGSGSEMIGALRAGWDEVVGVEQSAEYGVIARARIARWLEVRPDLDESEALASTQVADERQLALLAGGSR